MVDTRSSAPAAEAATAGRSLAGETITRRGSTRQFSGEPISALELSTALYHATRGWPADVPAGLVDLFVNVHAVEGIEPGAYRYHRADPTPSTLLRARRFPAGASGFLCLGQALGGASSATVFFLRGPRRDPRALGQSRLPAGQSRGRAHRRAARTSAAYAQGFGATGLTFYDRAVVEFFSPASAGLDALFVTALGPLGEDAAQHPGAAPAPAAPLEPSRPIC